MIKKKRIEILFAIFLVVALYIVLLSSYSTVIKQTFMGSKGQCENWSR